MVEIYYCNLCKSRHRVDSPIGKKHKKSANTGRPKRKPVKKKRSMSSKEKLIYNLSLEITCQGEEEDATSGAEGFEESEFDEDPGLKKALIFLIKKGYYNTKIMREGLLIIKKHKLDSEDVFQAFEYERGDEYPEIKEIFGLNKPEANKLAELYMALDWNQGFDRLVEEARKKGWKGKVSWD